MFAIHFLVTYQIFPMNQTAAVHKPSHILLLGIDSFFWIATFSGDVKNHWCFNWRWKLGTTGRSSIYTHYIYLLIYMFHVYGDLRCMYVSNWLATRSWLFVGCLFSIQSGATHVKTVDTQENMLFLYIHAFCLSLSISQEQSTCVLFTSFLLDMCHRDLRCFVFFVCWSLVVRRNAFCLPLASCLSCTNFWVDLVRINASPFSAGHLMQKKTWPKATASFVPEL